MEQEKLNEILKKHRKWLMEEEGGECADLYGANLRGANLRGANLRDANLRDANLCGADLCGADLYGANLRGANLRDADLYGANLCGADLYGANLRGADLYGANLRGADLYGANLHGADLDVKEQIRKGIIAKRKMTGWKKCKNSVIVKLEIPKGAIVFSINNNKCRTNIAKVVAIFGSDGKQATSQHDSNFIYKLGKTIKVDDFNCQYNIECSTGIHFFKTRKEAENYN